MGGLQKIEFDNILGISSLIDGRFTLKNWEIPWTIAVTTNETVTHAVQRRQRVVLVSICKFAV
jgi:hypothetical protein